MRLGSRRPQHRSLVAGALVAGALLSCAGPARRDPRRPGGGGAPPPIEVLRVAGRTPPRHAALEASLLGYVVVADLDGALARLGAALAPPGAGPVDAGALERVLLERLGLGPEVALAVGWSRPAALALLDPARFGASDAPPLVVAVPVVSAEAFLSALGLGGDPGDGEADGAHVFQVAGGRRLHVRFAGGYAVIAFRGELLEAAAQLVTPLLAQRPAPSLRVHASLDHLHAAYGDATRAVLARFAELTGPGAADPSTAYALRNLRRVAGFVESATDAELAVDVGAGTVELSGRMTARRDGPWAGFIDQQRPGEAWGVELLPADSALVYTTRLSPDGLRAEVEARLSYLRPATPAEAPGPDQAPGRDAIARAVAELAGEATWAVWAGRDGGVGVGGAYRVRDAARARRAQLEMHRALTQELCGLVGRSLLLPPDRFPVRVTVRPGAETVAGAAVDLVEAEVRWPTDSARERRIFGWLFGPQLTLATTFVGDRALFAGGRDWRTRLAALVAAARGGAPPGLSEERAFAEAVRYRTRDRVSLTFLSIARMSRLLVGAMREVRAGDPTLSDLTGPMLAAPEDAAIVSATTAAGDTYALHSRVPTVALPHAARLGAALWRIALAPVVSPPAIPPLPLPPPNVTPSPTLPPPAAPPAPSPQAPPAPTRPRPAVPIPGGRA